MAGQAPQDDAFHSPTPEALRQMEAKEGLFSDQWVEKTGFAVGVDPTQPAPEMRYQLLEGRMHTLQLFPSGAIARGEVDPATVPFALQGEGWYDGEGRFLGDEPGLPEWE